MSLFTDPVSAEVPYAILSHTWTDDKVTFEDMQDLLIARCKEGFSKIEATCQMEVKHGLQYAWVDTCCIDKSSSAEVSEAINSMFRWYKNALICFAFLSDLQREMRLWYPMTFGGVSGSQGVGLSRNSSPPQISFSSIRNGISGD
jgi:hypothetical protein